MIVAVMNCNDVFMFSVVVHFVATCNVCHVLSLGKDDGHLTSVPYQMAIVVKCSG